MTTKDRTTKRSRATESTERTEKQFSAPSVSSVAFEEDPELASVLPPAALAVGEESPVCEGSGKPC